MRQGILKLTLLVGVLGALALAPAAANAASHDVFILDTTWDPATLTVDPGDDVTWALNRTREGLPATGHDLWVCEGEDEEFNEVGCWYDTGDPEADIPENFVGNRPYCGWYDGVPIDECEDGNPSDLTLTFNEPGVFTYLCTVHGPMRGTLTVAGAEPVLSLSIKPTKAKLKKGKSKTVTATVNNTGEGDATGVKVCASGNKKKVKVGKCQTIGTVAAGSTAKAKIKVTVQKGKKAKGSDKVKFKLTADEQSSLSETFKVSIKK